MKILLVPKLSDRTHMEYEFSESKIKVSLDGESEEYDFSDMPDGELETITEEGTWAVGSELERPSLIYAKREDGVLWVKVYNYIPFDSEEKLLFPDWVDHEDYMKKLEEDSDEEDDLEEDSEEEEGEEDGEDEVEE